MTFEELQSICEKELQTVRLADIARELDVSPQVINNWKIKNQVPYKYVKILRAKIAALTQQEPKYVHPGFDSFQAQFGQNVGQQTENLRVIVEDTFKFFINLIKKNKIIVVLTPLVFSIYSIFYAFSLEPVYISKSKILPATNAGSSSDISGLASQFGISIGQSSPESSILSSVLYPDIIKSRSLARNVLAREFHSDFSNNKLPLINILLGIDGDTTIIDSEEKIKIGIKNLSERINVSSSMKSPLLILTVKAFEAQLASDISLAVIQELNTMQKSFKVSRIKEKRLFIEGRINDVSKDLIYAEENLKKFRESNRNIKKSPALRLEEDRLKREVGTHAQLYSTLKSQYELAQIEEVENSNMIDILDPPEAPLYKTGPKRRLIVTMSTFFGILFGFVIAFAVDIFGKLKIKI